MISIYLYTIGQTVYLDNGAIAKVEQRSRICGIKYYYLKVYQEVTKVWKEESEISATRKPLQSAFPIPKGTVSHDYRSGNDFKNDLEKLWIQPQPFISADMIHAGTLQTDNLKTVKQEILTGKHIHLELGNLERSMKSFNEDIDNVKSIASKNLIKKEYDRVKSKYDKIIESLNAITITITN